MAAPFEVLTQRFRARCSGDLAVLRQMLQAPASVSEADLKTLVHQMSGAAGAFGFPHLSHLAMQLDHQMAAGMPPLRADVQALIDELAAL
jgi:HPt (histidine-containing phosphotransfer) domain-containing protein